MRETSLYSTITPTCLYCITFLKPKFKLFLRTTTHRLFLWRGHFVNYFHASVWDLLLNYYWSTTELLLNYYWSITELLLNYYWSISEVLQNCYWSVIELFLNYYWSITEVLLNYYWIITEELMDYFRSTNAACFSFSIDYEQILFCIVPGMCI